MALLLFTEFNTSMAAETAVVLFKPGSKVDIGSQLSGSADEEKGDQRSSGSVPREDEKSGERKSAERALAEPPRMTDVFSWQHLQYTVPISGGADRRLLDDVSGYVAPGKLTALMGESGAGKVSGRSCGGGAIAFCKG